MDDVMFVDDGK